MPVPLHDVLEEVTAAAETKSGDVRCRGRFLVSAMLAGAYVGFAVVLLLSVSEPLVAVGSPFVKVVQGAVFGLALTLVVFAGAELFTGNVMVMLQGLAKRSVRPGGVAAVLVVSLAGNVVGSIAFAWVVHAAGTLTGPASAVVESAVAAKNGVPAGQLLARAVLCNVLVCLALWMAARTRSDGAKLVVLWWALLAFVASGFEHAVANVTLITLGVLEGTATWGMLLRNLVVTVPGNVIGGALVGLGYAWIGCPAGGARPVARPVAPAVRVESTVESPLRR